MSSLAHMYRELGRHPGLAPSFDPDAASPDDDIEDLQLASFESGYQAGWEDAIKAQEGSSGQAAIDVAQNLRDMAFTHREAYLKLSAAMKPLLTQMVHKLLPDVAHRVLGMHILHELSDLMETRAENAIEIAVAPENHDDIQALLSDMVRVPFTLGEDTSLSNGQAFLRVNTSEREINLTAVLSGIGEALEAFYDQSDMEITNG